MQRPLPETVPDKTAKVGALLICFFLLLPPIALGELVVVVSILLLNPNPNALRPPPPMTASIRAYTT